MTKEWAVEIWEVEMFKNWGTLETPDIRWGKGIRYYYAKKEKTDFDLHDIDGLRRNAKLINDEKK